MFYHFIAKNTTYGIQTNNLNDIIRLFKNYYAPKSTLTFWKNLDFIDFDIPEHIIQLPSPDLKLYLFNLIENYNYAVHVDGVPIYIGQGAHQTDGVLKNALKKPHDTIEWFSFYSGFYRKYSRSSSFDWKKEGF